MFRLFTANIKDNLSKKYPTNKLVILDEYARVYRPDLVARITEVKALVIESSVKYGINRDALGAILADEYCRIGLDDAFDWFAAIGIDTSVGLAQIMVSTAREMIQGGKVKGIPDSLSDRELYERLKADEISIDFAAARIRQTIDFWQSKYDLRDRPEILGTLYSQGLGEPKTNPMANTRGIQIRDILLPIIHPILNK